jgi:uncharacterized protein YgbK (DUF1537 family)
VYAVSGAASAREHGGLVVVGSYQPSTTEQLRRLLGDSELRAHPVEIDVREVVAGGWAPNAVAEEVERAIQQAELAVLSTSRELITGVDNLAIGRQVTDALLSVLQHVQAAPRFVIAKGGITSHEVAQRGLGAQRATVLGQLQPGVPVWRLASGPGLRHEGIPYVVFPGNVGGPTSLLEAARTLALF